MGPNGGLYILVVLLILLLMMVEWRCGTHRTLDKVMEERNGKTAIKNVIYASNGKTDRDNDISERNGKTAVKNVIDASNGKTDRDNDISERNGRTVRDNDISERTAILKKLFQFDHTQIKNCREMYRDVKDKETRISEVLESMRRLDREAHRYKSDISGNVGMKPVQALFFITLAKASFVNTICETGFNAGHSSYLWLTSNPKAQVYSFDLGTQEPAKPMFEYLDKLFPGRLHVRWGDSNKTIQAFTKRHPEVKCDLIFIDGGHKYGPANADMRNLRALANKEQHIVVADDFLWPGVNRAWMEGLEEGSLHEHFHCFTYGNHKWNMAVGEYM